jgi:hypothetical protein
MLVFESLKDIRTAKVDDVGSKARALAELAAQGFHVSAWRFRVCGVIFY